VSKKRHPCSVSRGVFFNVVEAGGVEPPCDTLKKQGDPTLGSALCSATDPDLATVLSAWPAMDKGERALVLAVARKAATRANGSR
jgi:hypothetical protein